MNWGNKIVVGMASFMLFIVGSGIYMVTHDSDSLIDENYYENSLTYDEVYDSKQNLLDDHAKPVLSLQNDTLTIQFVSTDNKGKLIFKRPSDGSLDKEIPFYTKDKEFKLPVSSFTKGNWTVEIVWKQGDKNYFHNQPLYIQ